MRWLVFLVLSGCYLFVGGPPLPHGMSAEKKASARRVYAAREKVADNPADSAAALEYVEAVAEAHSLGLPQDLRDEEFNWNKIEDEVLAASERALPSLDDDTGSRLLLARAKTRPFTAAALADMLGSFERKPRLEVAFMFLEGLQRILNTDSHAADYLERSFELCKAARPLATTDKEVKDLVWFCWQAAPSGRSVERDLAWASAEERAHVVASERKPVKFEIVNRCAFALEIRAATMGEDGDGKFVAPNDRLEQTMMEGVTLIIRVRGRDLPGLVEKKLRTVTLRPDCKTLDLSGK